MRILIADADEGLTESLESYLWDFGHELEIASDGLECTAILCDFLPDVLVLDRDLLWGGCEGVLAQMSDDSALADIPTILMADNDPPEETIALSRPPLVGWLRKPFRARDLLVLINSPVLSAKVTIDIPHRPAKVAHKC